MRSGDHVGKEQSPECKLCRAALSRASDEWRPSAHHLLLMPRICRAFERIPLGAGETKHVHFTLDARDLSEVNEKGDRIVAEGAYRISVGGSQPGTAPLAEAEFRIAGMQRLPE